MYQHLNIFESWRIKTTFTNIKYEAAEEATKGGEWPELLGRTQRKLANGMLTPRALAGMACGPSPLRAALSALPAPHGPDWSGSAFRAWGKICQQGTVACHFTLTHTHTYGQCFRGNRLIKAALDGALYEWKTTAWFFYLHASKCLWKQFCLHAYLGFVTNCKINFENVLWFFF